MAQMPIQLLATRANQFTGHGAPPPPRPNPHSGTYLIDPGGISGGVLRPGAMDQAQFKTLLAAAQKSAATAPGEPSQPGPVQPAAGILTLSPAQLAALGAVETPADTSVEPAPALSTPAPSAPAEPPVAAAQPAMPASVDTPANAINATAGTTKAATATAANAPMPRARMGADGVWELPRLPDKDERDMLRGQKWRLVEDPESKRLFLGEDGKFGWDDFVDLINPLQHIPLVNIAYRAITGDEINGAARVIDFAFGPVAGISTAIDLAFRDIAGDSMAGTAVAALFGGEKNGEALTEYTTASAVDIADLGRHGSHE